MELSPQAITIFGNICFSLVLLSFMVRKMLALRSLAIMAGMASIVYNYNVAATPLWTPITWNCVFISVNLFQIALLFWEKRKITFEGYEKFMHENVFQQFSPGEFQKLLDIGHIRHSMNYEVLIKEGEDCQGLIFILDGKIHVKAGNKKIAELSEGQFAGEMSFLTDTKTKATCIAHGEITYFCWPRDELKAFLAKNSMNTARVQAAIGHQLIEELMTQTLENDANKEKVQQLKLVA